MKRFFLASAALFGMASAGHSAPIPPTYAPTPTTFDATNFAKGVTDTVNGVRLSPFEGTSDFGRPYDVVYGNGGPGTANPYGLAAEFAPTAFQGSSGSAGTFTFLDGSPDSYNVLIFNLVAGGQAIYQGSQIAVPTNGSGYRIVNLTGIGAYTSVDFGSISTNAFEFAALGTVPLPASAPMFGGALLALGAMGIAVKRKKAAAAA